MAAYVIGEIDVTDSATYDEYRRQVLATVQKHGGRFLARGGPAEALEGGARAAGARPGRLTAAQKGRAPCGALPPPPPHEISPPG